MDSIEVGRQAARRLHDAAVASGKNPCTPYAFACAEAIKRGITVELVPRGDIRLHGGCALYDPDAMLILHEDAGDDFMHAFFVAHEIGHCELDGNKDFSATLNADPLRSADAAPVGIDRVLDYNRRERREVQMDLFAREFLLPRHWLRHLHLDESLSASQIAAKCKAPFAVVCQQLFDALLLPEVVPEPDKPMKAAALHPAQLRAVEYRGVPFLLEAGPGTGKTQTLVSRVESLLAEGVEPGRILVLTFSNKAAGELSSRVAVRNKDAAAAMWIGTFHAFGLDLIRRFHDQLGLPAEPRLLDRTDAIAFLEHEYPKLNLVHFKNLWDPSQPLDSVLNAISRANDEVVDAKGYRILADAMLQRASTDEEIASAERCVEVAIVFAAYEQIKLKHGCIDFGDLVSMPVRLCESVPEVQGYLKKLYQHVLVDEFQDVNRSSIRLLKAITREGENLWAVGDAKQSIYRFRGASSFNMVRFGKDDFPGGARDRLSMNYRSREEVKTSFVAFAAQMRVSKGSDVSLHAVREASGKVPERHQVRTDDDEIAAVAESIDAMRKAGHGYRTQAVLCSGNDRLARFAAGLERLGIPVLYLGSLFERSEIKDLLSILSIVVDRRAMGLLRAAALPQFEVSLADVDCVIAHLAETNLDPLGWIQALSRIQGISPEGLSQLTRIGELFSGVEIYASPWLTLASILLDRTRMVAEIGDAADPRARACGIAIWQFLNFLRDQPPGPGLPIARLLERIRQLVLHADERDLRQLPNAAQGIDAVRLMTMHASKGLEFEVVHIPGLTKASMPRSPGAALSRGIMPPDGMIEGSSGTSRDSLREAMEEEQECLFFVALSRARDRLFLYHPTIASNGNARQRSPFFDWLGASISSREVTPSRNLPPLESEAPIPITIDGGIRFNASQLDLHERCPRRYFYTHVLNIGGRRTESAFMRLHVAVQQVINEIGQHLSSGSAIAEYELDARMGHAWEQHGPSDHGYAEDYLRIASQLVRYYVDSGQGMKHLPAPELRIQVSGGDILITPDQVLSDAGGQIHVRRVRTGHKGSSDDDSLVSAAFHIAASAKFPGCKVQLMHLSDGDVVPVKMTDKVLGNRKRSIEDGLAAMRKGDFPLNPSIACPRCPAFFICGALPPGPLSKKIPN